MNKLSLFSTTVSLLIHVPLIYGLNGPLSGNQGLVPRPQAKNEAVVYYITEDSILDPAVDRIPASGVQATSLREVKQDDTKDTPSVQSKRDVKVSRTAVKERIPRKEFVATVENINLADKEVKKIFFAYYDLIRERLKQNTLYPVKAKLEGKEGLAYLSFVLRRDGVVSEIAVLNSSGEPMLDQAAMNSIRNASPFPPFPKNLIEQEIKLNVPISFELE
ncbi:MAG: energy transducer TonB [Candidatus Omnitrophica bacterium]|nr:energy transducer TonB [Candidatus Omnitrophota bacterium]